MQTAVVGQLLGRKAKGLCTQRFLGFPRICCYLIKLDTADRVVSAEWGVGGWVVSGSIWRWVLQPLPIPIFSIPITITIPISFLVNLHPSLCHICVTVNELPSLFRLAFVFVANLRSRVRSPEPVVQSQDGMWAAYISNKCNQLIDGWCAKWKANGELSKALFLE